MAYLKDYDSTVCVAYIYERLHEALERTSREGLAWKISELSDELAHNFEVDTGVKIGVALGWGKPTEPTEPTVQVSGNLQHLRKSLETADGVYQRGGPVIHADDIWPVIFEDDGEVPEDVAGRNNVWGWDDYFVLVGPTSEALTFVER